MTKSLLRTAASALAVVLVAGVLRSFPHVDRFTTGLLLLVTVLGIARQWGFPEAVVAALAGGLTLDYFFIPPFGFAIESPEEWLTLAIFLVVSITTSRLATQAKQRTIEAIQRRNELEKLYAFGHALLLSHGWERTVRDGLRHIIDIFGVEGAAFHSQDDDQIIYAGAWRAENWGQAPGDRRLREAAREDAPFIDGASGTSIVPIRVGDQMAGNLGLCGRILSESSLRAVAEWLGIALAGAKAQEETAKAEAARNGAELKSALLDGLAHGLKTPLTVIKIAAGSILLRNAEMPAPTIELLRVIDDETTHLEQFLNEALQSARIDAGILTLETGLHDVRSLIGSSLKDLGAALDGRAVSIRLPNDLPAVQFDFQVLKLALNELLANAAKYSPAGSPLALDARVEGEAVIVSVSDSGVGVEEEKRTRIFDKYYRAQEKGNTAPGTGLGLAIVKRIVQAHSGDIWAAGRPGGGSTFSFSLPLLKEPLLRERAS